MKTGMISLDAEKLPVRDGIAGQVVFCPSMFDF
jgi:hypothetical protein